MYERRHPSHVGGLDLLVPREPEDEARSVLLGRLVKQRVIIHVLAHFLEETFARETRGCENLEDMVAVILPVEVIHAFASGGDTHR